MSIKLGSVPDFEELGTRDAFHVPVIVARSDRPVEPGVWVRFLNKEATEVEPCAKNESHGMVDPFREDPYISHGPFLVLLNPGLVQSVRHTFDVGFIQPTELDNQLVQQRKEDPMCAECWVIEDGELVRY